MRIGQECSPRKTQPFVWIGTQRQNSRREGLGIPAVRKHPGLAIANGISYTAGIAGNHAQPAGIGFEQGIGQAVPVTIGSNIRREDKKVRPVHRRDDLGVWPRTVQRHDRMQAQCPDFVLQLLEKRSAPKVLQTEMQ